MRKIRDLLRLGSIELSILKIAASLDISADSAKDYLARARVAGLSWPLPEDMDDFTLESILFPPTERTGKRVRKPEPDYGYIHEQMKISGATLEVLHQEFLAGCPEGISYPLFCQRYRVFVKHLKRYLRKSYVESEVVFVDYSGKTVRIMTPGVKEAREAQIFVGVLGASNYTYAEAVWSQKVPDWIEAHINMFEYLGGVPHTVTPDNLKAGVTKPSRGKAEIQESYRDMANHYNTVIIPARVGKPKDKAKVEFGVRFVHRWILFRLRARQFTNLCELNAAVRELLIQLNDRPFQKLKGCRRLLF